MTEPEAVARARRWIPLPRANRHLKLETQIMTDLLSAYDALARGEAERFLSLVDVTNRCMAAIKEHDELAATVREREATAWDLVDMRAANPYREGKD